MINPDELQYLNGFGNEFETEAEAGALPIGQFNPQKVAMGLYAEQYTYTAFTMPRDKNRRSWFYRIRPSAAQGDYSAIDKGLIRSGPISEVDAPPNLLRWDPLVTPDRPTDFIDSLVTLAANGSVGVQGVGIHLYAANQSMNGRFFYNADGELLLVPQQGALVLYTECGILHIAPGESIAERIKALVPGGVDYAFEVVGHTPLVTEAFDSTRTGGTTVMVGAPAPGTKVTIDSRVLFSDRKLLGCMGGGNIPARDIPRIMRHYQQGTLNLEKLVETRIPLDRVNDAFDALRKGEAVRTVIQP